MQTWNSIKERLKNKGTILALAGGLLTILIQLGFKVDSEQVMTVVEAVCGLLILMGIMNNPVGNTAAYIPGVSDQLVEKPSKIEEPQKTSEEVAADKSTEVSNVKIPVVEDGILKADVITTGVIKTEGKEEVKVEEQPVTQGVEEVK